ncbi:retrovirus-related pol polyprotein from transposon TNT 1-94 [Tanacetum coccineum]
MTGNIAHLLEFKDFDGGYVTFGGGANGGRITGKDNLGKFDGKSDEGFFVGYSLSSKAFRVYNTRTRKVQENLHIGFLENKPMIEGNGPKWLFDLDSLTQSMNYVPSVGKEHSNVFAGNQRVSECSNTRWKISITKRDQEDISILKENSTADQQVNTASPEVNTGSRDVNSASPEVNTSSKDVNTRNFFSSNWQKVLILVDLPKDDRAIGHTQEEGIDYDEVFAPVARIEAIRIFLAYASYMGFMVYQMDSKVRFPSIVPIERGRGKIDQTMYSSRDNRDISCLFKSMWKTIIFGSTKKIMCDEFEKLMKDKFQMSSMGELTLFLGLQVQQKKKGIFISQDKYVHEILRKFNYTDVILPHYQQIIEKAFRSSSARISCLAVCTCGQVQAILESAEASTDDKREFRLLAHLLMVTSMSVITRDEASFKRHLKLDDSDPKNDCLGAVLVVTKATAVICLATNRKSDEGSLKLNELTNLVTKLSDRIGVLEDDLRKTKKTYSSAFTKSLLRGRKLSDAEVQEKASIETELFIQEVTPTEVIQDQGSISTAEVNISTAGRTITYSRRSEEKRTRKDKGKAIMTESEPKKKSKKELEQERLSFAEAIRLEEQMNKEQRAQIARHEEIARQWDKKERQRAMSEAKSTKKIDWNDPSVIRYHALKMKPKTVAQARRNMIKYLKNQGNYKISDFKGMSYNEIRPIFEKVWDFNQHIEPMEHGTEKIEEEDVDTQEEMKEVVKESGAKRKKSLPRKRRIVKRQKLEEDAEKEELKGFLDIIPREDVAEDVKSLSTKYPIVDWKTYTLTENFMYYQTSEENGSSTEL